MKFALAATALTIVSAVSAVCVDQYVAKVGDTCKSVAEKHDIAPEVFTKLNSELDVVCDKLEAGKTYCIASVLDKRAAKKSKKTTKHKKVTKHKKTTKHKKNTKKAKKVTKKKTTTKKASSSKVSQSRPGDNWSSTPKSAPSNAVRHIISTCTKYSTVKSSDSWCGDFAKRNSISTTQLYNWNAGLHRSGKHVCDNLDDGKAYCVAVSK
ncbi:hypothetical protein G6F56_000997 [Rhizopus delemar]|nr:hypothetical protein G6F56_000997 [Rhizopus delemar]